MNEKQAALENVALQAQDYFDLQEQVKAQAVRLRDAIKAAKAKGNTQQKIADACATEAGGEPQKLSRQRIAQIIQES